MVQRYAWIFVRGRYLFQENSFLREKYKDNGKLQGTDNGQGQIYENIFLSHGGSHFCYPSNVFCKVRNCVISLGYPPVFAGQGHI